MEYLRKWKESTEQRPGNFTRNARGKMFISWQTNQGLQITVHSVIEVGKFLLQEGMEYVLTERFCQDIVEEYLESQCKFHYRPERKVEKKINCFIKKCLLFITCSHVRVQTITVLTKLHSMLHWWLHLQIGHLCMVLF